MLGEDETRSPTKIIETYNPTATPEIETKETSNLKLTLFGVRDVPSDSGWAETTAEHHQRTTRKVISGVTVGIKVTDVQPSSTRRQLHNRALQSDPTVEVTYTQTTSYPANSGMTIEQIVLYPLESNRNRNRYVRELKDSNDVYVDLSDVSEITIAIDAIGGDSGKSIGGGNEAEDKGAPLGAIIGGVMGGFAVLILIVGFVYYKKRQAEDEDDPEVTNAETNTADIASGTAGAGTGSSVPTYGETSVATVDYDYSRAYGGAGAHSLSDAGGTLGSRTRQTAAEDVDPGGTSGNTIFSDDPTFDQAYEDVREELLDIYAPAGKLGVVIDTPNDGAPVVHAVKDSSAIASKVKVGDKLVAVDDEDVRAMTAIKVSKLISRKSNNASRKLTIIRHVSNN